MTTPSTGHVHGIDLLRFLAALSVVLFHFSLFGAAAPTYGATGADAAFAFLPGAVSAGWIGVQFFFVLSGYVIAQSALGVSWQGFAMKRAVRILPALWICATLSLLVRVAAGEPLPERLLDWLRTVLLSPKGPYIDGVVWTLVVEAVFYALVCAALALQQRLGGTPGDGLQRLALLLGGVSGLFLIVHSATVALGLQPSPPLNWFGFKVLLLHHGVYFALGMTLCAITRSGPSARRLAVAVLLVLLCLLEIRLKADTRGELVVAVTVWLAMLAALMLFTSGRGPRVAQPRARALLTTLGRVSYPLYLGHLVLGMYLVPWLAVSIEHRGLLLAVCLLVIGALALWIALGPEPWGQQRLKRLLQRLASAHPSAHPATPAGLKRSVH
ncbi:acyltransferase family protein [Hydrogenophaga flava]|uniref:acyltransferase family protein n=1 Tax=Hydrogenophaga flava TaxID=65657 RepID=UPI000A5119A4|nr:acyltransferase [Hydrogenophaga flava]